MLKPDVCIFATVYLSMTLLFLYIMVEIIKKEKSDKIIIAMLICL